MGRVWRTTCPQHTFVIPETEPGQATPSAVSRWQSGFALPRAWDFWIPCDSEIQFPTPIFSDLSGPESHVFSKPENIKSVTGAFEQIPGLSSLDLTGTLAVVWCRQPTKSVDTVPTRHLPHLNRLPGTGSGSGPSGSLFLPLTPAR